MAETSNMAPLGSRLPPIRLMNATDGAQVDVQALAEGKLGTLVMFLCNHCPYVVHILRVLVYAAHEGRDRGFAVVAINSNVVRT
ncbi:MAG: hypothetical protein M3O46_10500 [Myxococcota bacterium]|nr:hypothetical protein [Myxococcota bacterium]